MATLDTNIVTRRKVIHLVMTNDQAAERAVAQLYLRQTSDERSTETSKHRNSRGFSAPDAAMLTRMAEALRKYPSLTPNQLALVRRRVPKYWAQLLEIAQDNGRTVSFDKNR